MGTGVVEQLAPQHFCTECGKPHVVGDLVRFGDAFVCADCKPLFVQRMREGTPSAIGAVVYGGFWRRVAAQLVDFGVLFYMLLPLWILMFIPVFMIAGKSGSVSPTSPLITIVPFLVFFLAFALGPILYLVYFTTHGGSTPGKMMLGLKIVTASGGPVGTGRAIGRFFARGLSSAILYIGDMMAGFDSQKRALHDRICETRVIRIDPTVLGRRIGAFALDGLIGAVVGYAALFAWNQAHHISFFPTVDAAVSPGTLMLQRWSQTWQVTAIVVLFQMVYSVYFVSQKGATPGKMAAGLRIVTASGQPVGVGRALARFFSMFFLSQYVTLGIGFTMAAFDPQCRALEDRICQTRVVREFETIAPSPA